MFVRVSALVQEELASAIVRNPLVVPPDMTVMEAIAQMSGIRTLCQTSNEASDHINVEIDAHSSCVVIVENNQPVGIFTERDVVRLITQKADLENLPIRDVMTRDLITLPESELSDIFVALELLRQHKICHLPILDEQGGLVGLLTHGSLRQISSQVDLLRSQRQQAVIASMALHIQRAHTFEAVSNTIVQEIRSFLDADRAIIYRFNPDMSGEIVAEAVISPWESFLNTQIEDTCFRENLGGEYQKGKVFAANDIYKANLTECHIQLLERFQVKANLVVPILLNDMNSLWGLLIVHQCEAPRQWQEEDIQLLYHLSTHLAISLYQAELYQNLENLNFSLEEKVQERTQELQLKTRVLEEIHDAVVTTDLNGTILSWNHGAEQLYGYTEAEVLGQNLAFMYEDAEVLQTMVIAPVLAKGSHAAEIVILSKSGQRIYVSLRLSVVEDEQGNITHLIGCANDISDRKATEASLRESEAKSRAILAAIPDLMFRIGIDQVYREMVTPYREVAVFHSDFDLVGRSVHDLLPPELAQQQLHYLQQALQTGELQVYEQQIQNGDRLQYEEVRIIKSGEDEALFMIRDISDRKRAEIDLKESEQRYVNLVAASPVGIFRTDAMGHGTYVNERWCRISGLTSESAIGDGWRQGIHSEDRSLVAAEWYQSVQENRPFSLEYRFQRPDGEVTWVYGQSVAAYNADGIVLGYIGTITDISDRKRAEQELQQLNRELETKVSERTQELAQVNSLQRAILESTNYAIISTDLDGIIQTCNPSVERMLGYSASELIGITPEILHDRQEIVDRAASLSSELGQDIPVGFEVFVAKSRLGIVSEHEWTYIRKDSSRFPVLLSVTALKDGNQQIIGFVGIAKDITEQKQAEEALRESEQRFATLASASPVGIFRFDYPLNCVYVNERWCELTGKSAESAMGMGWIEALHPDDQDLMLQQVNREFYSPLSQQNIFTCEGRHLRPDGIINWFYVLIAKEFNEVGEIVGYIGTVTDITDRKRAEAELQNLSNRLGLALRSGAIGCWEWDLVNNIKVWDARMYEIYGLSEQDINSIDYERWANIIHPDDRTSTTTLLQQAISGETEYNTEFRILHSDGSIHFIRAYGVLVRDEQGNPQNMIGINFDISDRKQTEAALIESEAKFRRLVEGANDLIWSTDANWCFNYLSPQFQTIFGFDPNDWIGKPTFNLVHPEDHDRMSNEYVQAIQSAQKFSRAEFRHRHQDGHYLWVSINTTLIMNTEGVVIGAQGLVTDISDRKQSEEALRESEELKRRILESSSDCIKLLDLNERILYMNEGGLCILEIDDFSVVHNADWISLWPEASHSEIESAVSIAKSGQTSSFQGFCPTAKGTPKWWDVVVTPIRDGNGQVVQLLSVSRDITARKQAEQEILEKQQFIQQIADLSPNFLYLYDFQEKRTVYANREVLPTLGYSVSDIQEMGAAWLFAVIHPDDMLPTLEHWERLKQANDNEALSHEYRLQYANGEWRYLHSQELVFSRDAQGQVNLIIGTAQDITDRKKAEIALRASDQRWQFALESAGDGVWDWNVETNEVFYSEQWKAMLGYADDEIDNRFELWENLVHPDDLAQSYEDINKCINTETLIYENEHRLRCKDGSYKWILARGRAIEWGADGQVLRLMGTHTDLSDRKQAEIQLKHINEELLRATKLKDEFLANMSHELRTPLNSILGLSNALGEQVLGSLNEKQLRAIGTVESSGEHLLSLINDILDLSKISSGMMELNVESVSVKNLCDSSLVFVKQQAFQKQLQLNSNIPKNINKINVEERRIRQVLINLLTNAVKFTPSQGQVNLLVSFGGGDTWQGEATIPQRIKLMNSPMIVFQVVDTGIGIAPNDLQRLFQPFVQVSGSLNRQYEGTGLGLALVKQIVELHGGQVMAESEIGKGSCFSVALPYEPSQSSAPESTTVSTTLPPVVIDPDHAPLILLAEDNEANIDTFTAYLTAINYRIVVAKNGEEVVAMAKSESPDIIIMDIQMPGIDGLEAISLIRADTSIALIPIIALTALAMEGDRERCLAAGANEYLAKPIKFRQLNAVIQQILI